MRARCVATACCVLLGHVIGAPTSDSDASMQLLRPTKTSLLRRSAEPVEYEQIHPVDDIEDETRLPRPDYEHYITPQRYVDKKYDPALGYYNIHAQAHRDEVDRLAPYEVPNADGRGTKKGPLRDLRTPAFENLNDIFINPDTGKPNRVPDQAKILAHTERVQRFEEQRKLDEHYKKPHVNAAGREEHRWPEEHKYAASVLTLQVLRKTHKMPFNSAHMTIMAAVQEQLKRKSLARVDQAVPYKERWMEKARYPEKLAEEHFKFLWPRALQVHHFSCGDKDHLSLDFRIRAGEYLEGVMSRLNRALDREGGRNEKYIEYLKDFKSNQVVWGCRFGGKERLFDREAVQALQPQEHRTPLDTSQSMPEKSKWRLQGEEF